MIRLSRISALVASMLLTIFCVAARTSLRTDSIRMEPLPVYDSSHPSRIIRFTPVVSVGGMSTINNYKTVIPGLTDIQTAPGTLMRAGMHVDFFIHRSLSISTGLEGSVNNSRVSIGIINSASGTASALYLNKHFYEAIVPVSVSFRLNMGWRLKSTFGIGAYMAKGIGGTVKASGYTSGINSIGQPVVDHLYYTKDYYSESMPVINSVRDFDFGPRISAGFLYRNRFSINLVFQTSVRNLSENHNVLDIRYRHINLAWEVGYSF